MTMSVDRVLRISEEPLIHKATCGSCHREVHLTGGWATAKAWLDGHHDLPALALAVVAADHDTPPSTRAVADALLAVPAIRGVELHTRTADTPGAFVVIALLGCGLPDAVEQEAIITAAHAAVSLLAEVAVMPLIGEHADGMAAAATEHWTAWRTDDDAT